MIDSHIQDDISKSLSKTFFNILNYYVKDIN